MELTFVAIVIAAYLIGSISSAILLCKIFSLPDPRTQGSNNPGATNILRMGHKGIAISVLIFDALKGTIPVLMAYFFGIAPTYIGIVALAACLGHMYPIFFRFKGGKAVATAFGVLLPIGFWLSILLVLTWVSIIKLTRYSSLAAIITVLLAPCYTWLLNPIYVEPVIMLSCLIIFRHRTNIYRLLTGTETQVSIKK